MLSPEWKSKVGSSTSVTWPVGAGAKGSDGVAATVKQMRGGIGYDESAYATQNQLTTALLQEQGRQVRRPLDGGVRGVGGQCGLVEGAELRHRPEQRTGRRRVGRSNRRPSCCCRPIRRTEAERRVKKFFDWGFSPRRRHRHATALHATAQPAVHDAIRAAWTEGGSGRHVTAVYERMHDTRACRTSRPPTRPASSRHRGGLERRAASGSAFGSARRRRSSGAGDLIFAGAGHARSGMFVLLLLGSLILSLFIGGLPASARSASASCLGHLGSGPSRCSAPGCRSTARWSPRCWR